MIYVLTLTQVLWRPTVFGLNISALNQIISFTLYFIIYTLFTTELLCDITLVCTKFERG